MSGLGDVLAGLSTPMSCVLPGQIVAANREPTYGAHFVRWAPPPLNLEATPSAEGSNGSIRAQAYPSAHHAQQPQTGHYQPCDLGIRRTGPSRAAVAFAHSVGVLRFTSSFLPCFKVCTSFTPV